MKIRKPVQCKDCKYFKRDKVYKYDGVCLLDDCYTRELRVCSKHAIKKSVDEEG